MTQTDDDQFLTNDPDDVNPMYQMKKDEELADDFEPPFSPPEGVQDRIDDTHPSTDTDIEPMDHYDEGIEGAAGVDLPGLAADEEDEPPFDDLEDE